MAERKLPDKALYRATFRGPRPRANWVGISYSKITVLVEVYPETRTRWRARVLPTRGQLDVTAQTPDHAQAQVAALYEEQVTEWVALDFESGGKKPAKNVLPVMTHIAEKDNPPLPRQETVRAACGKEVRRLQVVEPDMEIRCVQCAIIAAADAAAAEEKERPENAGHISKAVQDFMSYRLDRAPEFHIGDMRAFVADRVAGLAPSSADRAFMSLRDEGVISYEIVNQAQGLYRAFEATDHAKIGDPPPTDGGEDFMEQERRTR